MPTILSTPFYSAAADHEHDRSVNSLNPFHRIRDVKSSTPPVYPSSSSSADSITTKDGLYAAPHTDYTATLQMCSLVSSEIAGYDPHYDSDVSSNASVGEQAISTNIFDETPIPAQPIHQFPAALAYAEHPSKLTHITAFMHTLQSLRNQIKCPTTDAHIHHIRAQAYHAALIFRHLDHDSCYDHTYRTMVEMLAEILFDTATQKREQHENLPKCIAAYCSGKSSISKLHNPSAHTTIAASPFYLVNSAGKRLHALGTGTKGKVVKTAIQSPAEIVAVKKIPLKMIQTVLEAFRERAIWSYLANNIDGIIPFKSAMIYRSYKNIQTKYLQPEALCFSYFTLAMFSEKMEPLPLGKRQLHYQHYADLARIIANVHRIGFIHNDIKAENILIKKSDNHLKLYLIDFGISFCQDEKKYTTSLDNRQIGGTYPPPEVNIFRDSSKKVDLNTLKYPQKIDVWAFGQVLLVSWFPEIDDMIEYLTEHHSDLSIYDDNISEPLRDYTNYVREELPTSQDHQPIAKIITHCLEYNPDNRWTMQQVVMALDEANHSYRLITA